MVGAAATDTIGSPPSGTSTPSQGSPSPGAPTASETVNMVTGNLSIAVSTPQMQAVSGPVGVTLTYNSTTSSVSGGGSNYGLTAQYHTDDGSHSFNGALVCQRTEAGVDEDWSGGGPVGGLAYGTSFMARWTGVLTLSAGTWELGGETTGGMRVIINGSSTPAYNDWAGTASANSPSYGTTPLAGSQQYQVEIDDWETYASGAPSVQLWAQNTAITDPSTPSAFVVPSSWTAPTSDGVPPGWSLLSNAAAAQWIRADDEGNQVVLEGHRHRHRPHHHGRPCLQPNRGPLPVRRPRPGRLRQRLRLRRPRQPP